MDDLSTLLHAASSDAPPTRVTVDGLLAAERRRKSRVVAAAAGGAVAVVLAGAAVMASRPGDEVRPSPPAAPASTAQRACPRPSSPGRVPNRKSTPARPLPESHEVASRRLTAALAPLLPAGTSPANCDRVEVWWSEQSAQYQAGGRIPAGTLPTTIVVLIRPREPGDSKLSCADGDGPGCTVTAHGTQRYADSELDKAGRIQRTVTVARPDDTRVQIVVIGARTDLPAVATLTAIASAPPLTLYPAS
ncbi:hypothetical protein [Actinoplanes sp. N902-109]|uniref:hypothetical protein n=1 Tax=Actinoplanes sp. (strain N902-109) TaxID=649831 RepID=UPI00032942C7|nr:hypothetical protein [Actinoplanes sp. N902-109]AGL20114.1 hypothetical protein L083_6604 [Actinoplanes sp. N902-109]